MFLGPIASAPIAAAPIGDTLTSVEAPPPATPAIKRQGLGFSIGRVGG